MGPGHLPPNSKTHHKEYRWDSWSSAGLNCINQNKLFHSMNISLFSNGPTWHPWSNWIEKLNVCFFPPLLLSVHKEIWIYLWSQRYETIWVVVMKWFLCIVNKHDKLLCIFLSRCHSRHTLSVSVAAIVRGVPVGRSRNQGGPRPLSSPASPVSSPSLFPRAVNTEAASRPGNIGSPPVWSLSRWRNRQQQGKWAENRITRDPRVDDT